MKRVNQVLMELVTLFLCIFGIMSVLVTMGGYDPIFLIGQKVPEVSFWIYQLVKVISALLLIIVSMIMICRVERPKLSKTAGILLLSAVWFIL